MTRNSSSLESFNRDSMDGGNREIELNELDYKVDISEKLRYQRKCIDSMK